MNLRLFSSEGLIRRILGSSPPNPFNAGGWATATYIATSVMSGLLYLPLARLLSESDFGLYAEAIIVYSGLILILENSLIRALVRTPGTLNELAQATLWLSVGAGLVGALLCALAGIPMSIIYNDSRLLSVLIMLAVGVLATALGTVPYALLARDLNFRRRVLPETIGAGIAVVIGIGAALLKFGVYSLVIHVVALAILKAIVAWIVVGWRPERRSPDWALVRRLLRFGIPAGGGELALYARFNIDYAIGGYRLGTSALGVYTVAWNTAERPALFIKAFFGDVGYATFARLQKDRPRLLRLYLTATRLIAVIIMPLFLSALLVRQELVSVALGSRWQGAVEPLLPFFILQVLWITCYPSVNVVLALGHSRIYAALNFASLLLTLIAVLIGSGSGIIGLAWAMLVAVGLTSLAWGALALLFLRPNRAEIWYAAKLPLLFTGVTVLSIAIVQALWTVAGVSNNLVRLGGVLVVGGIVLITLVRLNWSALRHDISQLREKLPDENIDPIVEVALEPEPLTVKASNAETL